MRPSDRDQVEFLTHLQRLLVEGNFTSSYKFALLLALASVAVEKGDDSGDALPIKVDDLAEKFIQLYWRQAAQHPSGQVLFQNTDRQAAIITALQARKGSLAALKRDRRAWRSMVTKVAAVIKAMPLFKLQTVGGGKEQLPFLYANEIEDDGIELRPGVAFCLRQFHALIEDLVRGAWIRFVRRLRANRDVIGEKTDLSAFMFGSERNDLSAFVPILRDLQHGACFYCSKALRSSDEAKFAVDHFIPWSWYSVDLGHNFVLTDDKCNAAKGDTLAGVEHLERWRIRNDEHGDQLGTEFDGKGLLHDLAASRCITTWAYEAAASSKAQVWIGGKNFEALDMGWRRSGSSSGV